MRKERSTQGEIAVRFGKGVDQHLVETTKFLKQVEVEESISGVTIALVYLAGKIAEDVAELDLAVLEQEQEMDTFWFVGIAAMGNQELKEEIKQQLDETSIRYSTVFNLLLDAKITVELAGQETWMTEEIMRTLRKGTDFVTAGTFRQFREHLA